MRIYLLLPHRWLLQTTRGLLVAMAGSLLLIANLTVAAEPPVTGLAFTPDGKSVVAVGQNGIRVLSWPELRSEQSTETSVPNLHCVSFSPNGKQIAVGGGTPSVEGTVEIFAWPTLKPISKVNQHDDSVTSVAWFGDTQIISASLDRQIQTRKMSGELLSICHGHSRAVSSLCLLSDEKTLVSAGADQTVRVWNLSTGNLIRSLSQHTRPVHAVAPRPTASGLPMVASASVDRTIRFWQPTIGRMVRYIRLDAEPLDIAWTHDGARIVAACSDGHVRVVDPIAVKVTDDLPAIEEWAYAISVHPTDNSIAVGGTNGQIRQIQIPETNNANYPSGE